jgi:hypothetical protein
MMIGVLEEAGEHLHHPRIQPLFVGPQRVPWLDVGIARRQPRVRWQEAELLLLLEHLLAIGIPAVVEHAPVLGDPLLGCVVRRVHRAGAEVHEERLVGRDLLGIGDETDRAVDKVLGQVIALLGRPGRGDLVVVVD